MKSKWSKTWKGSKQPRKQRKYKYKAPLHTRQGFVSVHLEKSLRSKVGRRSLPIRKGDEIKIMRGKKKGVKGKVADVDLKKCVVHIEGQTREGIRGMKSMIPFQPSNLILTDVNMDDRFRNKKGAKKDIKKREKDVRKEEKIEKPKEDKAIEIKNKKQEEPDARIAKKG